MRRSDQPCRPASEIELVNRQEHPDCDCVENVRAQAIEHWDEHHRHKRHRENDADHAPQGRRGWSQTIKETEADDPVQDKRKPEPPAERVREAPEVLIESRRVNHSFVTLSTMSSASFSRRRSMESDRATSTPNTATPTAPQTMPYKRV